MWDWQGRFSALDVWIQRMALGQRDLGFLEQLAVLKWIDAHWDASWCGQLASGWTAVLFN